METPALENDKKITLARERFRQAQLDSDEHYDIDGVSQTLDHEVIIASEKRAADRISSSWIQKFLSWIKSS
jgi:hypothetical protein